MRRWFESLPLDRKLIAVMLAVSTAAVVVAVVGLVAFDIGRYRAAAAEDAHALAQVIAENAAAAILFNDAEAAGKILTSMRVRPVVSCACVYRVDDSLLASYQRTPDADCPSAADEPTRLARRDQPSGGRQKRQPGRHRFR